MNSKLSSACSDDVSSLKDNALHYIALGPLEPAFPPKSKKSGVRGFKHPVLGRLLCPVKYLEDFDRDPQEYGGFIFVVYVHFRVILAS
jgi:hypothetical protein